MFIGGQDKPLEVISALLDIIKSQEVAYKSADAERNSVSRYTNIGWIRHVPDERDCTLRALKVLEERGNCGNIIDALKRRLDLDEIKTS
jgi:hypothetical protein